MMFDTDRLRIRVLDRFDQEVFYGYRTLPEVCVYQAWKPADLAEVAEFIQRNVSTKPDTQNTWLQLAIYLKDGTLIGDLGVHFLEGDAQVEIGYTLAPRYQGNGYATEAVKALLQYLFLTLKKHRVTASVDPLNTSSIKLLTRLKFRKEAHFVKSFYTNGDWQDDCIYAMLAEEWL